MANLFTRIPDRPVPALPGRLAWIVAIADAFMIVMRSRPRTGSLRNTWVTPATIGLTLAVLVAGIPAVDMISRLTHGSSIVGGLMMLGIGLAVVGSAAVATVGLAQRWVAAHHHPA